MGGGTNIKFEILYVSRQGARPLMASGILAPSDTGLFSALILAKGFT